MSKTFGPQYDNKQTYKQNLQEEKKAYRLRKQEEEESVRAMLDFLEHKDDYGHDHRRSS